MDEFCEALALAELNKPPKDDDDEDDEFAFYWPEWYVIDTWLEHKNHHTYPEPGGYNDQDAQLMEDWKTLNGRFNLKLRELSKDPDDEDSKPEPPKTTYHATKITDF